MEAADAPSGEFPDEAEAGEADEAAESKPSPSSGPRTPRAGLQGLHHQVRRDRQRRGSLRTRGIAAPARLSRQAVAEPFERRLAPRQSAAAPADGAAEPLLGIRSRRGHARSRAAVARRHRSAAAAVVQAREGHGFPRYGGDAADRQFRLDARAPDHGGGDLRRHIWRARWSAAASRSRFSASPPAPGRADSRAKPGCRPASRPLPAASTICAISSTRAPTRRGGARARISG